VRAWWTQKGSRDVLLTLKKERREKNGRERKIKDRCFSTSGCQEQDSAVQLLWKQGRGSHDSFPNRKEENETPVLRKLMQNGFLWQSTLCHRKPVAHWPSQQKYS